MVVFCISDHIYYSGGALSNGKKMGDIKRRIIAEGLTYKEATLLVNNGMMSQLFKCH
jgi:hypothetical protein